MSMARSLSARMYFRRLSSAPGAPEQNMQNQLHPLFACPLVVFGERYAFNDAERQYLAGLETVDNDGNAMSANDRVLDSEELSDLRQFLDRCILIYKRELLRIKDENEIFITQSWVNRSTTGDYHPRHRHPNSVISGVLFLDDNSNNDLPAIRFHRSWDMFPLAMNYDELTDFNAESKEFYPQEGMLILFPSLLEHDVDRNKSDRVRSSLSFNTFVRGKVGTRSQLTEIDLS